MAGAAETTGDGGTAGAAELSGAADVTGTDTLVVDAEVGVDEVVDETVDVLTAVVEGRVIIEVETVTGVATDDETLDDVAVELLVLVTVTTDVDEL